MAIVGTVALGIGAGVATLALSPLAVTPSRACNPPSQIMSRLELLFGMKKPDGDDVAEDEWRAFLDAEVTPRFPDGLTVLTGYGQWRATSGRVGSETSRVLLVWLKPSVANNDKIEAIRIAWKIGTSRKA
ncbi:MAG: DUF3574 domain-containing protein [Sphingomonadales bacterium]|nr:DUF3574 domain-containing protein [Sphingomonadales bacterium]